MPDEPESNPTNAGSEFRDLKDDSSEEATTSGLSAKMAELSGIVPDAGLEAVGGTALPGMNGSKPASAALTVGKATLIMMSTVLLSRILGLLRDVVIAHEFGRNWRTDAYNAAFTVPDLLFYLLQSGALGSTIIPILTSYTQEGKQKMAEKTFSVVATVVFLVIGTGIALLEIFTRWFTLTLNPAPPPGSPDYARLIAHYPQMIVLATHLTRILLPAQICFFLGGLLMSVLYSRKQFFVPALGPVIYNAGIICGGLLFARIPGVGISGLVWGAVGGAVIGNLLIPMAAVMKLGFRFRPSLDVRHPGAQKFWRLILAMSFGAALPQVDQIVNKYFASRLGPGEQTAIMAAYRLMLLPIGVFAQSAAMAAFPFLSSHAADRDLRAMRNVMNQSLRNILFLTAPASGLMFLLAAPLITLLFQSGQFTAADTIATAAPLRFLSLGIFIWSCQSLITRSFYALQEPKIPVRCGTIVTVIFIGMNWLCWKLNLGTKGIALATTISAGINTVALLLLLVPRLRGIQGAKLLKSVLRIGIATAALCIVTLVLREAVDAIPILFRPKVHALMVLAIAGGSGVAAYLLLGAQMKMPEMETVTSRLGPWWASFKKRFGG